MNNQLITPTEYEALPVERKECWKPIWEFNAYGEKWKSCTENNPEQAAYYGFKTRLMYAPIIPIKEELTVTRVVVADDSDNGWIRVEDRLPEVGLFVLVRRVEGYMSVDQYRQLHGNVRAFLYNVTHWQPLPPPPTI